MSDVLWIQIFQEKYDKVVAENLALAAQLADAISDKDYYEANKRLAAQLAQAQAMYTDQRHAYNEQKKTIGELEELLRGTEYGQTQAINLLTKEQQTLASLRAQLKIAVDALEHIVKHDPHYMSPKVAYDALAEIEKLGEK